MKGAKKMVKKRLGLEEARRAVEAMLKYQASMKPKSGLISSLWPSLPSSFAVVDNAGILIYFVRMDGAAPLTARMAINKAYTAIDTGRDTIDEEKVLKEVGRQITDFCDPRLTSIPGGVLIKAADGSILGAIGASGRLAEEDEELARVGAKTLA